VIRTLAGRSASDYRCGQCGGAVPDHRLRASAQFPEGECECGHCGARIGWRGGRWSVAANSLSIASVLGLLSWLFALRQLADGHWITYALIAASALCYVASSRLRHEGRVLDVVEVGSSAHAQS